MLRAAASYLPQFQRKSVYPLTFKMFIYIYNYSRNLLYFFFQVNKLNDIAGKRSGEVNECQNLESTILERVQLRWQLKICITAQVSASNQIYLCPAHLKKN